MPRNCKNKPDSFCYVCGHFTPPKMKRKISKNVGDMYLEYFKCPLGDQDKNWAPHIVCVVCYSNLRQWKTGKLKAMPFAIPMIWREQRDHSTDCYFCLTDTKGLNAKKRYAVKYPNLLSAIRPVAHSVELPKLDSSELVGNEDGSSESNNESDAFDDDINEWGTAKPHFILQAELDDLVRDMSLTKENSMILGSRLKQWNLLDPSTTFSQYKHREREFIEFFTYRDGISYCQNIEGLITKLGAIYAADDWRLFIDGSKTSLKAVLLHNGNNFGSVPLAYAVGMKENYGVLKTLLELIKYAEHGWKICSDLKVVGILIGLQYGNTKYPCFLCLWDSRDKSNHFQKREWTNRNEFTLGKNNVVQKPLVEPNKILIPPLHLKLGLMKNFVKAMDKEGAGLRYLGQKFTKISKAKINEGIFVGPDIRKLFKDEAFVEMLSQKERDAWLAFKSTCENFLGNHKAANYDEIVEDMLLKYRALGCKMSLKVHMLHSHLDYFPQNLGAVSEEQGERFHQDLLLIETRYKGKWSCTMMADYCWSICRSLVPNAIYNRQSIKSRFLP